MQVTCHRGRVLGFVAIALLDLIVVLLAVEISVRLSGLQHAAAVVPSKWVRLPTWAVVCWLSLL